VGDQGERPGLLPLLGWAGFSLLVLYVILLGGGWIGVYTVSLRVLSLAIVAAGLAAWLLLAWRHPEWRPTTAIWPAFVVPLAAFVLSVAASPFPRLGLEYLAWAVLLTALYLLLARIMALPYARARIGSLAAMLALVLGGAYVVMAFVLWVEWWGLIGELRIPPLRPMYLAMPWGGPSAVITVQILLAAAAAAGLGFSTRGARAVVTAVVILTGLVAVISGSRSGWLALAAALVIVAALWTLSSARRDALAGALRTRRVQASLVGVGIIAIAMAIVVGPAILGRFVEGGDGGRPVYWATALRMLAESPVLGLGPGNWSARRMAYTEAGELDFYIPHAHDQVLETGAEFGIVGLAAGLVALVSVAWLIVGAVRGADPWRRRWAWAATFSLLYLAIATVVDSYTFPAILLPLAIPIACLDATSSRAVGLPRSLQAAAGPLGRLAIGVLTVGCIVALVFLARAESVALTHARAVSAANDASWARALQPALDAAAADPGLPPYQVTAGLAAAGAEDWTTAEAAFRAASAIDDLPASWLGLALAQSELGRPPGEVEASLKRAMRLGEQHAAISLAVGQVYERLAMSDAADDAYVDALAAIPGLAADEQWAAAIGASGRFAELVDRAIEAAPGVGWELALMAGDVERARALAAGQSNADFLDAVIDAWSGDPAAVEAVLAAAAGDPMDASALAWAARLSDRLGDGDAADGYRRLIDLGVRGAWPGLGVRVGERVPKRDAALGTGTYYYGNYLYRRTTPIDLIVPGLPGLVFDDGRQAGYAR
jgi:O-antigen ligase/tetratricopeptide (TPR) repeat protein